MTINGHRVTLSTGTSFLVREGSLAVSGKDLVDKDGTVIALRPTYAECAEIADHGKAVWDSWLALQPGAPVTGYDEYNPRLKGEERRAASSDPNKPDGACCNDEHRGMNGGCGNCGDPAL